MKNILEVDSVILEFGARRILQDVYLKTETNKVTGLLGRNGTGKSCLFKILSGELISNSQSVRINGRALLGSNRTSEDIKYLPQNNFVPKFLTIKRVLSDFNVEFDRLLINFPEFQRYQESKLMNLSSGQRRIIEIFIILTSKSKFCLLDEPFSQIMPLHVEKIKEIILEEKNSKGIIISDHMFDHILELSDDLYVISDGKTYLTNGIDDIETLGYARINN